MWLAGASYAESSAALLSFQLAEIMYCQTHKIVHLDTQRWNEGTSEAFVGSGQQTCAEL